MAGDHGGRTFARACVILLREGQDFDRGRSDPVTHHAVRDRTVGATGRQSDEGLSGFAGAVRVAAAGYTGAAIARVTISRTAYTACAAARTSSEQARRYRIRRQRQYQRICDRPGSVSASAVR